MEQPSILFGAVWTGTLSAAAEQLGTEHTTVARHIHALEEELNSRLFHRSNNGYGLTEVGERLLAGAEAIESAYASAKAAASSEDQTISGTVRISTPDGFGSLFLAPRVRVLTDRHPKLEIEILATAGQFSLLRFAGLSGEGNADRHNAGSQEPSSLSISKAH